MRAIVLFSRRSVCVPVSESLNYDRVEQRQVFCASNGQFVGGVVVNDLWYCREWWAILPKDKTAICKLSELHMHEALTAPVRK